jgi:chromosome partitioning protein
MIRPVLTFFNNKGGVGKTTLVYHVAWMLRELGRSVVVLDLDPQANLTASFLDDERVERLWSGPQRRTMYGALAPLFEGEGGLGEPYVEEVAPNLGLVPGDLLLSGAEQELSFAWAGSLDGQLRAFRVTAVSTVAQSAADRVEAAISRR